MTKSVNFNVRLENDPTKAQEVALFDKIVDQFKGSGTYLEMLFTEALREFVVSQIANDFSPSVDEYMDTDGDEVAAAVADARHWQEMYEKELKNHQATVEVMAEVESKAKAQIDGLMSRIDTVEHDHIATVVDLREQLDVSRTASQIWEDDYKRAAEARDRARQELVDLKAQMFDKIMSGSEIVTLKSEDTVRCEYCGTEVVIGEEITFNDGIPFCSERHGELFVGEDKTMADYY